MSCLPGMKAVSAAQMLCKLVDASVRPRHGCCEWTENIWLQSLHHDTLWILTPTRQTDFTIIVYIIRPWYSVIDHQQTGFQPSEIEMFLIYWPYSIDPPINNWIHGWTIKQYGTVWRTADVCGLPAVCCIKSIISGAMTVTWCRLTSKNRRSTSRSSDRQSIKITLGQPRLLSINLQVIQAPWSISQDRASCFDCRERRVWSRVELDAKRTNDDCSELNINGSSRVF